MVGHGDEPVFVRSRWGANRWVYNWRNPVGRALIVITTVGAVGALGYLYADSRWSEGEFRDAVHAGARDLEARPQKVGGVYGYEQLISDAIERTGKGPSNGAVRVGRATASDGGESFENFEISTQDVDGTYCMSISPPMPTGYSESKIAQLSVRVADGSC